MKIEKVTLIGMGAAGAFFAPRLYNWLDKGDFRIVAEGTRKERLEKYGITVNGIKYDFPIVTPSTKGDPADLIIIATKITDLEQAIKDIKNQVGKDTIILSIQNGLDSEERVAAVYFIPTFVCPLIWLTAILIIILQRAVSISERRIIPFIPKRFLRLRPYLMSVTLHTR